MKRALVVYESMFGNTGQVAQAVADGLGELFAVTKAEVSSAPRELPNDVELLVVGGPTHAFSMSRPRTRKSAAEQGADVQAAAHDGIREWISQVSAPTGTALATFDTKVASPRLPGSAAAAAQRRLRRHGLEPIAPPETFFVTGTDGELVEGEIERARTWASGLGHEVSVT